MMRSAPPWGVRRRALQAMQAQVAAAAVAAAAAVGVVVVVVDAEGAAVERTCINQLVPINEIGMFLVSCLS